MKPPPSDPGKTQCKKNLLYLKSRGMGVRGKG